MDFFDKSEIEHDFRRIDALLKCGIVAPCNMGNPLFQSAFIEMLICLRDLMYKAGKYAKRIDFTDDVTVRGEVKDVTDLIKYVRDAMCHLDSDNHYIEPGNMKASFNVQFGKGTLLKIGDFVQSSPYEDDICFFFGSQRIFLKRHIHRAVEESRNLLSPLLNG